MIDMLIGFSCASSLALAVAVARELWRDVMRATWEEGL